MQHLEHYTKWFFLIYKTIAKHCYKEPATHVKITGFSESSCVPWCKCWCFSMLSPCNLVELWAYKSNLKKLYMREKYQLLADLVQTCQLSRSEVYNHPILVDETKPLSYMHPNYRWEKCCFCLVTHDINCQMVHDIPWHSSSCQPRSAAVLSACVTLWKLLVLRCRTSASIHFTPEVVHYEQRVPIVLFI